MVNKKDIVSINIEDKTKEEVQNMILDINEKQLEKIGCLAILEAYLMHIDLEKYYNENIDIINKHGEDGKDVIKLIKKIQNKDLDINLIINSDKMPNELGEEYFKNLRMTSQQFLNSIAGYITEISYINETANEIIHREEIKNGYVNMVEDIDVNKFYENVYKFLTEDMDSLMIKAMEIVSVIPLRIPRKKYYDMIKSSIIRGLNNNSKSEVALLLDRYKTIFNGSTEEEYGQKFDYYFRKTHKYRNFDFKTASKEEIQKVYNDTTKLLQEINILVNIIRQSGLIINRYIVINMVKNKLIHIDKDVENIIDTWDTYIQSKDSTLVEKIRKKCVNKVKKVESEFNEYNEFLQKLISEFSKQNGKMNDEDNSELFKTQKVLAFINDKNLEEEELLYRKENEVVNESYLEQATDNFIEFIDRNSKSMVNVERKARMRRLLTLIDFPFKKPEEFFSYLKNSVENTSKEDLIVNINLVAEIIAQYKVDTKSHEDIN